MSLDRALADAVRAAIAPLEAKIEALLVAVEVLRASQPELLSVPEACRRIRGSTGKPVSEATMWRWIRAQHVQTIKMGKRTFVVSASLAPVDESRIAELAARPRR